MEIRKLQELEYYDRNGQLKLTFNRSPYYASTIRLKDWSWGYDDTYGQVDGFYRSKSEYELETGLSGDGLEERDALTEAFEADVLAGKPGKLKMRGWELECFILEAEYEGAIRLDRKCKYKVKAVSPGWTRRREYNFDGTHRGGTDTDYGRNYSFTEDVLGRGYNYGYDESPARSGEITLAGAGGGYEAIIYGPATDPVIYINDNRIKVNVTISASERLKVVSDGRVRTVEILQADGSVEDAFVYRDKEKSIFFDLDKENEISFGELKFDFIAIERRSEPTWI